MAKMTKTKAMKDEGTRREGQALKLLRRGRTAMKKRNVDLYEDSGGGLHLLRDGDDVAYCNLDTLPSEDFQGGFLRDAKALAAGETEDWTLESVQADQELGRVIASYNGETDVVALVTDLDGEPIAGGNGRDYVGSLPTAKARGHEGAR